MKNPRRARLAIGMFALMTAGLLTLGAGIGNAQASANTASAASARTPALTRPTVQTADADTDTDTGWVRLAHLSPDTTAANVTLSALAGGVALFELDNVSYGQVSPYSELAAGTYTISMTSAGAANDAEPMISGNVTIAPGEALTVAALGPNKTIGITVFEDDLTSPADGEARIRLIQASTMQNTVDVVTTTGLVIAKDAVAGSATDYVSVPAGPWTLEVTAGTTTSNASIDLAPGSVSTLFILDNASGGLTIMPVLDSASAGDMPIGGVATGGGGLAHHDVTGKSSGHSIGDSIATLFTVLIAVLRAGALSGH